MAPADNPSPPTPTTAVRPADAPPTAGVVPLPPPRTPPDPQRLVGRLRVLDALLVVVVLLFAFLSALFPARNSDFFLHAATGRLIAQGQYQIGVDPFAFSTAGAVWINPNWLFDLIVYLIYMIPAVGGTLLIVLKALTIAALAEVMLRTARDPGRPLWVPACCVALAVLTLSPRLQLQPVCVSYLLLGLTYWLLRLPRIRRAQGTGAGAAPPRRPFLPFWFIPPLCLLWANLDGWFFLGPVTVALYLIGESAQEWLAPAGAGPDAWAPGERRTLALVLAVSLAACLVNPHHVGVFTPPAAFGLTETADVLRKDDQFQVYFLAPFEALYFNPYLGLSVAGLAFYALALAGVASFAAAQWAGRWSWARALLWAAFFVLAVWRAAGIPFFAVVAGPIASLNFLDFAAKQFGPAPLLKGRAGTWGLGGRVLTLAAGVLLLVAAWPGWLQAAPHELRRVGWTVEPDPALRAVAERVARWRAAGLVEPGARWFNTSPAVLPYLAWYAPGERGLIDNQRLGLYDQAAGDYKAVRKALAFEGGDANAPDPAWRPILRRNESRYLIWYEYNPVPLRPNSALPTLLSSPKEWPVFYLNGAAGVFGWRDPAAAAAPGGDGPADRAEPFARLEADPEKEAFGPDVRPVPKPHWDEPPRAWWQALWAPEPPRPAEADEAGVEWVRFTALQPLWRERNETKWNALWADYRSLLQTQAAVGCVGAGGPWKGTLAALRLSADRDRLPKQARLPSSPPQRGEELQYARARQLFDFGPPGPLYLALRAARRAVAAKPDEAPAYQFLGQVYYGLIQQTREGDREAAVVIPLVLRRVQIAAALRRALELDPNNQAAVALAARFYRETGFLDLALVHAREFLRIRRDSGASEKEIKGLGDEVKDLEDVVSRQNDTYLLQGANQPVLRKVEIALSLGLGQTALDELGKVAWDKFDENEKPRGVQRQLSLLAQTGRVADLGRVLVDEEKNLKDGLSPDPDVGLPGYEWLWAQVKAAEGDYDGADHWMGEIEKKVRRPGRLAYMLRALRVTGDETGQPDELDASQLAALLPAYLVLREAPAATGAVWLRPPLLLTPGPPLPPTPTLVPDTRDLILGLTAGEIAQPMGRAADLETVRGWLALEAGDIPAARSHFDAASALAPVREIGFAARPLADLGMEFLDAAK